MKDEFDICIELNFNCFTWRKCVGRDAAMLFAENMMLCGAASVTIYDYRGREQAKLER